MPLTVFEHQYFLTALAWATINSLWQAALLWLLYRFVTSNKKQTALFRHNAGMLLLLFIMLWFICTIVQNYLLLVHNASASLGFTATATVLLANKLNAVLPAIALLYLILLGFYLLRLIIHYNDTQLLKNNYLQKTPAAIRFFTVNTATHLGIKKKVQVWLSSAVDTPSVMGWTKPVILLPLSILTQLDTNQVEAILLHELAHIKRNDFLLNLLQSLAEAILFFNPFVKLLGKAIRQERENCCDDWVMNFRYNGHDYATALLLLEQQRRQQPAFALAATGSKNNLLQRVKRLFATTAQVQATPLQKLSLAILSTAAVILMLCLLPQLTTPKPGQPAVLIPATTIGAQYVHATGLYSTAKEIMTTTPAILNTPMPAVISKTEKASKKTRPVPQPAVPYTLALINAELLGHNRPNTIAITTSEKEYTAEDVIVKVEEVASGSHNSNTYYFELNNTPGQPQLKPLVILNKVNIDTTLQGKPSYQKKTLPQKNIPRKDPV
jgi:beta-lactamase regulating signal transducer with metallopeptidase domain